MALTLVLAGCGKMGGAMLSGWLERNVDPAGIHIVEPSEDLAEMVRRDHDLDVVSQPSELASDLSPDVVVFAVKPQVMDNVVPAYARFKAPGTVFLSIAAGKTIDYFQSHLGEDAAIVRSMPNTPAAVGRGATVACPNRNVQPEQIRLCQELLEAVGSCNWVDDEGLMDAVTAVSGSGPAYVFNLVESLAQAGVEAGLSEELAGRLARLTVAGAGELLHRSTEEASTLRQNVTSPGGTTAAALEVLMDEGDGLQPLLTKAVGAAARRSKELAG